MLNSHVQVMATITEGTALTYSASKNYFMKIGSEILGTCYLKKLWHLIRSKRRWGWGGMLRTPPKDRCRGCMDLESL